MRGFRNKYILKQFKSNPDHHETQEEGYFFMTVIIIREVGNPSETDSTKFKISSKTWEKGQHKKDTIIYITSDSQVNSNFPYRWSPASLTSNNYFYLFLYLTITRITINNNAQHLKSRKNLNRRATLGRSTMELLGRGGGGGGLQLVCGRINLYLSES